MGCNTQKGRISFQYGESFQKGFRLQQADGTFVNWNNIENFLIQVSTLDGQRIISFSLIDGDMAIDTSDSTRLIFSKDADTDEISPGMYQYQPTVIFNSSITRVYDVDAYEVKPVL